MTVFGTPLTIPTLVSTGSASNNHLAAYFRTTFTLPQDYTKPRIRMLLDDGALIYLDGVLIARVNKANNTEGYRQFAIGTNVIPETGGAAANNEGVIQAFPLDVVGGSTTASSQVVVAIPKLTAGVHTLAVSVRNNNTTSSDMAFGLELRGDDAGLSAQALNLVRLDNNGGTPTPTNVADDTFRFDVQVSKIGLPTAVAWTSDNLASSGPTTGDYLPTASVYTFTYPAQASASSPLNTATITFADSNTPAVTTTLIVTSPDAPAGPPLVLSPATPLHRTGFEESPVGTLNQVRKVYNTEMGFASNSGTGPVSPGGATLPGGVYQDAAAAVPETNKSWRALNGTLALATEAIGLDTSVKGVKVTMKARSFTTTGTSFETADAVSLGVETSTDGIAWTLRGNVLPVLTGSPDSTLNQAADRIITLLGDDASSLNSGTYITLTRETVPVSGATSVRLRYTNAADLSTSENILLDDLKIEIASADPDADSDNDGATNSQEEEWGSDRGDPASRPGYLSHSIRPGANPGETVQRLEFSTGGPFHSYSVRASDDLVTWADTPPYPGIDDVQVHEDTGTGSRRFFQIRSNY